MTFKEYENLKKGRMLYMKRTVSDIITAYQPYKFVFKESLSNGRQVVWVVCSDGIERRGDMENFFLCKCKVNPLTKTI